jgi:hypothetical protein
MYKTKQIINSSQYQSLIDNIQKKTKLKILNDYQDTVASRDEQKIEIARLSEKEIFDVIDNQKDSFLKFVLLKMQKFENMKIDEEYPKGEEQNDEEDNNETILGYSKSFLLLYLIEYCLLKNNPYGLLEYLKSIRIPNAKKYEKELKEIYIISVR